MRRIVLPLAIAGLFAIQAQASRGAAVTFAQFGEFPSNVQNQYVFALNQTGNTNTLGIRDVTASAVTFRFLDLVNNPLLLGNDIRAVVTLSGTSRGPATTNGGNDQRRFGTITETFTAQSTSGFGQTINGVFVPNNTNLLSLTSQTSLTTAGDLLTGEDGGGDVQLGGSDKTGTIGGIFNNDVVFSSFYIPGLATHMQDAYSESFTLSGNFGRTSPNPPGVALLPFIAVGSGQFRTEAVPEPSTLALLFCAGISGSAFLVRRRNK